MKKQLEKKIVINLTLKQLIEFNIHLGYNKEQTVFLASWMFECWRDNVFIFNLYKTYLNLKNAINAIKAMVRYRRQIWFITLNIFYGPLLSRYAIICGEPYNTYAWIGGTISNYKRIIGWHKLLLALIKKNRFSFRYMDKRQIISFYGLINYRRKAPGLCFMPTVLDNVMAVDECVLKNIASIVIVDSNTVSADVSIPLPSNSKSKISVNFFIYFFSRLIYNRKIFSILYWKRRLLFSRKFELLKKKFILLNFLKKQKFKRFDYFKSLQKFRSFIKQIRTYHKIRVDFQLTVKTLFTTNDTIFSVSSLNIFNDFKNFEVESEKDHRKLIFYKKF